MESVRTTCCVVGGGPAGIMLGYLLARAGVDVMVLEKHADFFRDFRGDTVHPSTLEVMHELGLLEDFLKLPHQKVTSAGARVGDFALQAADFSHLPTRCKFIALMPQWDFLNFLSDRAKRFPRFQPADAVRGRSTCCGTARESPEWRRDRREGPVEIQADLVVACDGRHSTMRQAAGLEVQEFGVPIDVLWFRISRRAGRSRASAGKYQLWKSADPDQPRRLFSGRADHPERLVRANQARRAGRVSRDASRGSRRIWAIECEKSKAGIRSSCSRCRSTGCGSGIFRACCASATPRMPCRRRAAWESIWRSRMRWRRRIHWLAAASRETSDGSVAGASVKSGASFRRA